MNQTDRKRFLYINFIMKRMNDTSDEIYEALADSDEAEVYRAVSEMIVICNELIDSISDGATQTEADA